MTSVDVSINFQDVVLPCLPTPAPTLYLDNTNQQVFFHVEILFFYTSQSHPSISLFQHSLEKLLVPYHFAAGQYQVNEELGRLEVVCNRAGALFAAASSTMPLSELGNLSSPNPEFRKLILYPQNIVTLEQIPLLTVQVTEFACGGYVLGVSASHCLFDGIELYNLLTNYSNIVRGDKDLHLTLKPVMDKTHLNPLSFSPESKSYVHNELLALPVVPARVLFDPADYSLESNPVPPDVCYKSFVFTPTMLASLKRKANSDGNTCSTFEALAAHVWQSRTMATYDPDISSRACSKLFVAMDTRRRLPSSVFPSGFAGSSIVLAPCVDTSYDEVCRSSLANCVRKVQETLVNATESFIRSQLRWCEGKHGVINLPGGMLITTWSKLGFDTVDFGSGKPAYVAPVISSRTEHVVLLNSCLGDGGVDVFMAIDFDKMNELEKNLLSC